MQQHTAAFTGVEVVTPSACIALAAAADPSPIYALLYFCSSSHQLTLQQPVVQNVQLTTPPPDSGTSSDSGDGWHQSVLAFGGSVNASITGAMFADNAAGTLLVVRQQAALLIANSTFKGSRSTWGGEQASTTVVLSATAGAINCKNG
jgi:hypothetical protein